MKAPAWAVWACVLGAGLLPAACTPRSEIIRRTLESETPPEDFALAVTVVAPAGRRDLAREDRPARHVLEPDGTLRVLIGPGTARAEYPPIVRVLSPEQRQELWTLTREAGLNLDTDQAWRMPPEPASFQGVLAPNQMPAEPSAVVSASLGQVRERWMIPTSEPGVRALVTRLSDLAWIPK